MRAPQLSDFSSAACPGRSVPLRPEQHTVAGLPRLWKQLSMLSSRIVSATKPLPSRFFSNPKFWIWLICLYREKSLYFFESQFLLVHQLTNVVISFILPSMKLSPQYPCLGTSAKPRKERHQCRSFLRGAGLGWSQRIHWFWWCQKLDYTVIATLRDGHQVMNVDCIPIIRIPGTGWVTMPQNPPDLTMANISAGHILTVIRS